jgi:hypothetical protein
VQVSEPCSCAGLTREVGGQAHPCCSRRRTVGSYTATRCTDAPAVVKIVARNGRQVIGRASASKIHEPANQQPGNRERTKAGRKFETKPTRLCSATGGTKQGEEGGCG